MSRDVTIRFRCTSGEKERWEGDAAKANMTLSEWLRWRANSAGQHVQVIASAPVDAHVLLGMAEAGVVGGQEAAASGSAEPPLAKAADSVPSRPNLPRTFRTDFRGKDTV